MRKTYFSKLHPVGKSRNETQWGPISVERLVAYCATDYMNGVFLEHLPSTGPVLEAGCGLGQYVIHYKDMGYQIYGLEWVSETLRKTKLYRPDAGVLAGDVHHLPFKDRSFKMVFSGGVLEHFEAGPGRALEETRRVLDDDGLLLVKVPYLNAIRRLEDFLHLTVLRKTLNSTVRRDGREMVYRRVETVGIDSPPPAGYHFLEYYFTKSGFISLLERSGFKVLEARGASIETGLLEFPWFRALFGRFWPAERAGDGASSSEEAGRGRSSSSGAPGRPALRGRLKKLLISEVADGLPSRVLLGLLRSLVGQQIVLVCRKLPRGGR